MARFVFQLLRSVALVLLLVAGALHTVAAAPCFFETSAPDSLLGLLDRGDYATLDARLSLAQSSYRAGSINDVKLQDVFLSMCDSNPRLKIKYDAWVAAMPQSYVAHLTRANYLREQGWYARGEQYASETSEARFDAMEKFNRAAKKEYVDSLRLEQRPILSYVGLIDLTRHDDSSGRDLIDRALKVDPKAFVVRRVYMTTLETRWRGSLEEMEDFSAESKPHITLQQAHVLDAMVLEDRGWSSERAGDERAAAQLFQNAAEHIDDTSQVTKSWLAQLDFEAGWAYEQLGDLPNAVVWLRRSVALDAREKQALSNLGWSLQKSGQATEAASFYRKGAELGDSFAQDQYGKCLWFGLGIPQNQPASVPYFERSAAGGSEEASRDLYWATKKLNLPQEGSLSGKAQPNGSVPVGKTPQPAVAPKENGPTDS